MGPEKRGGARSSPRMAQLSRAATKRNHEYHECGHEWPRMIYHGTH